MVDENACSSKLYGRKPSGRNTVWAFVLSIYGVSKMATALALISQIEMKIIATDPAKVKWILKEVHMASSVPSAGLLQPRSTSLLSIPD